MVPLPTTLSGFLYGTSGNVVHTSLCGEGSEGPKCKTLNINRNFGTLTKRLPLGSYLFYSTLTHGTCSWPTVTLERCMSVQ